jgi:hypothetical protein
MSRPQVVRALVPHTHLDLVLDKLGDDLGIDRDAIEVTTPAPGAYRDDEPNVEARSIFRTGRLRLVIGALLGALLGAAVASLLPFLRELLPTSAILLAFGFGWGTAAAMFMRGVQVQRDEGPPGREGPYRRRRGPRASAGGDRARRPGPSQRRRRHDGSGHHPAGQRPPARRAWGPG